jgi:hypothetical protein
VRLSHSAAAVRAAFDDPNLVSCAGLAPAMRLAQSCDLSGVVGERVRIPGDKGANASGKVATIVAGMLTGADSIDDLDIVRHGGMPVLFGGVYAPSTLGEFLRAFSHGHVRQLQAAARELLVGLTRRAPLLPGAEVVTFVGVDSLLRRVYGKRKQGAAFGYAKVGGYQVLLRGLNPLLAMVSTPDAAPVIAATQLRAGNASSARGAARLVAEAIATTRTVLATQPAAAGEIVVRADSAFYSRAVIATCWRVGARFSVTMRVDAKVRRAIETIPEQDRRQRPGRVVHRLALPRRVHRQPVHPGPGQHRGHAVIEQVFAELIDGPLAYLPSGRFNANNAWLACVAIAHNLTRAAATLAGARYATARAATIRRHLINVAGRIARHARGITIHLPQHWPWQHEWLRLFRLAHAPPT